MDGGYERDGFASLVVERLSGDEIEEVRMAMMPLEQDGRIKAEPRRGGLETWRTDNTPPPPSWSR